MTEGLSAFRPSNIQLDPRIEGIQKRTEMLNRLVDTSGQDVEPLIVETLLSEDIKRLVIMGQPGAGKTTLLYQVDRYLSGLAQLLEIPFARSIVLYDSLLRSARRRKEDPDTPQFNQTLVEHILNPKRWTKVFTDEQDSPKRIVLAEIPAVGDTQPKDRGVSAFEKLARDTEDTLFLYVVAHPLSQITGLAARFTAVITPEEDVIRELAQRHNLIIEAEGINDQRVLGRKIKKAVQWTAKGTHIKTILNEMGHQFSQWRHLDREAAKEDTEKIILPESYNPGRTQELLLKGSTFLLDPEGFLFDSFVRDKAFERSIFPRIEAAYAEYRFRQLGVPSDRYIVAFNPYIREPIHLYIKA